METDKQTAAPEASIPVFPGVQAVRSDYRIVTERNDQPSHTFHDIISFAAWLNRKHKDHEAEVDILCCGDVIEAWRDGGPGVSCEMRHTPIFARWLKLLGERHSYKTLIVALREVEETIDAAVLSILLGQLHKLKVVKGSEVEVRTGANGNTEFVSKTGSANVEGTLPKTLTVNATVYAHEGAEAFIFEADINMNTDGELPTFSLSAPRLANTLEAARKAAIKDFVAKLSTDFLVGFGELRHATPVRADELLKAQFAPPAGVLVTKPAG